MLTIVIPYYKQQFFRQTLNSLANQSDQRFQVVIGDDHSPESPQELLEEFNSKFNLKYIRFDNNLGQKDLPAQWSRCVEHVNTEWFMILGDDDVLSKDVVAGFYQIITQKTDAELLLRYSTQIIDANGNNKTEVITYPDLQLAADFIWDRYWGRVRLSLSEFVFRTEDFQKYGIRSYPKGFFSDNWLVMKYSAGKPIQNVKNGFLQIRMSKINLSNNPASEPAVREAEVMFYRDMLFEESEKFSKKQLSEFINVMVIAVNKKKISVSEFFAVSLKHLGIFDTLRKMMILLKYNFSNNN